MQLMFTATKRTELFVVFFLCLSTYLWVLEAKALSCAPPEFSFDSIVNDPTAVVFVGVPIMQKDTRDENTQQITVSEIYKGSLASTVTGVYRIDATWGYGCGTGPSELDQKAVFVAFPHNHTYVISDALPLESERAIDLLAKFDQEPELPTTPREPVSEVEPSEPNNTEPKEQFEPEQRIVAKTPWYKTFWDQITSFFSRAFTF